MCGAGRRVCGWVEGAACLLFLVLFPTSGEGNILNRSLCFQSCVNFVFLLSIFEILIPGALLTLEALAHPRTIQFPEAVKGLICECPFHMQSKQSRDHTPDTSLSGSNTHGHHPAALISSGPVARQGSAPKP